MSEDEQIQEEKVDFLTLAEVKKMIDNVDVLKYKVLFLMATIHGAPRGGNSGAEMVAVGMPVTRHPPHRSQRAELPHWAHASGNSAKPLFRPGVKDAGRWKPPVYKLCHTFPVQ